MKKTERWASDISWEEAWKEAHPGDPRDYWKVYRDEHPETTKRWRATQIERRKKVRDADPEAWRAQQKAFRDKARGIPEADFHARFHESCPSAFAIDHTRPDFYVPGEGFVEIKRALPYSWYQWRLESLDFPGLYFPWNGAKDPKTNPLKRHLDVQLALMPRPLTVIVYHALEGHEICRKTFL